ncbi:MAG: hypothetical protein C0432_01215 [Candidatus Puniceispirillum sp.]|nr:hypothetical protein [Candidatus Pelagibacter sp.]MBA4282901.1 hypothetical protein [Candidatus Puniceispirillum sp.]
MQPSLNIGFIEISAPSSLKRDAVKTLLLKLGFNLVGHHKLHAVELYKNVTSYIALNYEQKGRGNCREGSYVQMHGLCISGLCLLTDRVAQLIHKISNCGGQLYKYHTPFNLQSFMGLGDSLLHILDTSKWKEFLVRHFDIIEKKENTLKIINSISFDHLQISIFKAHELHTLKILCEGLGLIKTSTNALHLNNHVIHSVESHCKNILFRVQVLSNNLAGNNNYLKQHQDSGISMIGLQVNNFESGIPQEIKNKMKFAQRSPQYYIEASDLFQQTCINFFKLSKQSLGIDGYVDIAHYAYFTTVVEESLISPLQFILVQRPKGSEKFVGNFEYFT